MGGVCFFANVVRGILIRCYGGTGGDFLGQGDDIGVSHKGWSYGGVNWLVYCSVC